MRTRADNLHEMHLRRMLGNLADECIYYAVVPTFFITAVPTWNDAKKGVDFKDKIAVKLTGDNLLCVRCRASVEEAYVRVCYRVAVAKTPLPDGCFLYTTAYSARSGMCNPCSTAAGIRQGGMLCDAYKMDYAVGVFKCASDKATEKCLREDLTGDAFFARMMTFFDVSRELFLKHLGKLPGIHCEQCNTPGPGYRCSGCMYFRYCGPACQKAHWKTHKRACKELAQSSIFYLDHLTKLK